MCSGDVSRSAGSFRLAFQDFGPPSHPHSHMFPYFWFAVPGHYDVLTNTNLRSSKTRDLEWAFARNSPPRGQGLREWERAFGACYELGGVRGRQGWNVDRMGLPAARADRADNGKRRPNRIAGPSGGTRVEEKKVVYAALLIHW